jgi:hypothetical protein
VVLPGNWVAFPLAANAGTDGLRRSMPSALPVAGKAFGADVTFRRASRHEDVHDVHETFMTDPTPLPRVRSGATPDCGYGTATEMGPDNPQNKTSHWPAFLHG